jgi:hypothetical protein
MVQFDREMADHTLLHRMTAAFAVVGLLTVGCGNEDSARDGDDGTLVVFGCQGETGTVGATFMGVPAYCQPPGAGFYQCDELANRFMRDAFQHPNIDNVALDFAKNMCDLANAIAAYSVWGPGYRETTGNAPVAGDLVVWWSNVGSGHVAVVTGADASSVAYMQQNAKSPTATIGWDPATSFFRVVDASFPAKCWIHPEPSPAPSPPSGPDCGCFDGEGDYCGLSILDHQEWFGCAASIPASGLEYDTLYSCAAGVFTEKTRCGSCVTDWLVPALGHCR